MADTAVRILRDGRGEGENAPGVLVKDSLDVSGGSVVFYQLLHNLVRAVQGGRASATGVVVVCLEHPQELYHKLCFPPEVTRGTEAKPSPPSWVHILDCYSDPLGWIAALRDQSPESNSRPPSSAPAGPSLQDVPITAATAGGSGRWSAGSCQISSLVDLRHTILQDSRELRGEGRPSPFYVAIDSVSPLLRHHALPAVASFVHALQWAEQVAGLLLLIHEDVHKAPAVASLEYLVSATLTLAPLPSIPQHHGALKAIETLPGGGPTLPGHESGEARGRIYFRQKRRNGKVRQLVEEVWAEPDGSARFAPVASIQPALAGPPPVKSMRAEIPFNLELTEKERLEREKVVLPYEHQGGDQEVQIYDGRQMPGRFRNGGQISTGRTSSRSNAALGVGKGEIHYERDSDEDLPDSDEDPDDDLDI